MIKTLVIKDINIDSDILLILEKFPKIRKFYFKYFNKVNAKKILKKHSIIYHPKSVRILKIKDIPRFKYKIPLNFYREKLIDLLLQGKKILDSLEEHTKNFNKHYRKLDLYMTYESNLLSTQMKYFLDLHLAIQILLTKYNFKNIFIPLPKGQRLFLKLFELNNKDNDCNIYYIKNSKLNSLHSRLNSFIRIIFPLIESVFLKFNERSQLKTFNSIVKPDKFNNRYIFNKKNPSIGFLYNSITHKRVGNDLFNYLKNKRINVIEINPSIPKKIEKYKQILLLNRDSKRLLDQIQAFHEKTLKRYKNPVFTLYFKYFLNIFSLKIKTYLLTINYLYKRIKDENIDLLVLFNSVSYPGRLAILICKELNIPILYINHASMSEDYTFTLGKWCDIIILNNEIEKQFLLENKLDPKIYSNKLIPLGRSYFKPDNLRKLIYLEDIYDRKYNRDLREYKFKILLALIYESSSNLKIPYTSFKLINQVINILKNQSNSQDFLLIIKLHPVDNAQIYKDFFRHKRDIPIVITHQIDIRKLIISSDLFLSPISNTNLEGILLKTPTIIIDYYYNIGYYLFNDESIIRTVHDKEDLKKNIELLLLNKDYCNDYINKTYNFGLKFCNGFNENNFTENLNKNLFNIIQKLLK